MSKENLSSGLVGKVDNLELKEIKNRRVSIEDSNKNCSSIETEEAVNRKLEIMFNNLEMDLFGFRFIP